MSSNMEVVGKKMIMSTSTNSEKEHTSNINKNNKEEEDQDVALPGFRFHPTDEELVGFYLRRKVEKKPISIELIKQIDIYKYDPWDLPKVGNVGDKEWYFFCIRGRKYRNSIRPNRVTGSGFWKATGIDKPIYSAVKNPHHGHDHECDVIGLKKSLVYYRGSAGKGTKTDWMMHEFRLPPPLNPNNNNSSASNSPDHNPNITQEAEVWTLCRIFKRIQSSYTKKYNNNMMPPDHQNKGVSLETMTSKKSSSSSIISSLSTSATITPLYVDDSSSKTCSLETDYNHNADPLHWELDSHHHHLNAAQLFSPRNKRLKPVNHSDDHQSLQCVRDRDYCDTSSATNTTTTSTTQESRFNNSVGQWYNKNSTSIQQLHHQAPIVLPDSSFSSLNLNPDPADHDFFTSGSWDELRSVVQLAVDRSNASHQLHDIIDKPQ